MNIYVKTKGNMVGLVLTGNHNKVCYYKAFKTQTTNPEAQTILATQRAVSYVEVNKSINVPDTINIYSDKKIDMEKLHNDEYIKRHRFNFVQKEVETEQEKQRMLLARVEIDMETSRKSLFIKSIER